MEFPHNFNETEFDENGAMIRRPETKQKKSKEKISGKRSEEDEEIKALEDEIMLFKKNERDLGWRDREKLQILEDRLKKAKEG